jgi:DNA recombination protein RmuC
MVVRLPGGRQVVVDAKVSLEGYLSALECSDEDKRTACLAQHCRQMKDHIQSLSLKSYWEQFEPTPEFVVMFVPGEAFLQAACAVDATLIEQAMQNRVVPASPTTLVALLRAVAYGWRQEQITENAQRISELGAQLYDRMRVFANHMSAVGKRLDSATEAYNQAVGSLESRVLPTARRFQELGAAAGAEIAELAPADTRARELSAPEAGADE